MAATHVAPITTELDPAAERDHERDFAALADRLERGGRDAEQLIAAVHRFEVALPSWAFATGGTRFGRFPGAGEPRTLREKMEDAAARPSAHRRRAAPLAAHPVGRAARPGRDPDAMHGGSASASTR